MRAVSSATESKTTAKTKTKKTVARQLGQQLSSWLAGWLAGWLAFIVGQTFEIGALGGGAPTGLAKCVASHQPEAASK